MTTTTAPQIEGRAQCVCNDPEVDRLRVLISQGHDQIEASRIIWGTPPAGMPPAQHDLLRDEVQRVVVENRSRFPRLFRRGR